MLKLKSALATALLAAGMVSQAEAAAAIFMTSAPYLQFADSPFFPLSVGNPNFFLEDFEDGEVNTPGVSASAGVGGGQPGAADSVDADDGSIDGNGSAGHSWYSGAVDTITFVFNAAVLGRLPTHVGIVWTDVGESGRFGSGSFAVRAADENHLGLGGIQFDGRLGDGAIAGGTAEDRFFGVIFDPGISTITITSRDLSRDWEIDHLQYGFAPVPVPGTAWMLTPALAGLLGLHRKRA